ncbi:MAG: hypothetical protein A2005_00665 [Desulfuromonadales bacterium GWC2_61_20]|nr:MAG: hypothetical protein A2005_00665 [Desulfuromonadales bacterium GWC2_61_20]
MSNSQPSASGTRWQLNVTEKIVAGYLALAFFSFGALLLALFAIHSQAAISRGLVNRDFKAVGLIRDLRGNLAAQERLERQFLILHDSDLLSLRQSRSQEFSASWKALALLDLDDILPLHTTAAALMRQQETLGALLQGNSPAAELLLEKELLPLRSTLDKGLLEASHNREALIDRSLQQLYNESDRAYRFTLVLLVVGVAIGGGIAIRVVQSIRHSLRRLTEAVRDTAEERFNPSLHEIGDDEFGRLAGEFVQMGIKLRDLKRQHLDANPLTHLPGNLAIERELERRIASGEPFAHVYIDLDHFKAYGDRYGYQKGSDVLAFTGELIRRNVEVNGNPADLVGHIGGDDYLVLTTPGCAEPIARSIIKEFDEARKTFYTSEDCADGQYEGIDRFGEKRTFPLMSISIAIICSDNVINPTRHSISAESSKMKEHLKQLPGSNYLVDRRKR